MNYYLPCKILLLVVFFGSCFANIFQATELETEVKVLSDRCVRLETIQVGVKHCVLGFFSERINCDYRCYYILLQLQINICFTFPSSSIHNCCHTQLSPKNHISTYVRQRGQLAGQKILKEVIRKLNKAFQSRLEFVSKIAGSAKEGKTFVLVHI